MRKQNFREEWSLNKEYCDCLEKDDRDLRKAIFFFKTNKVYSLGTNMWPRGGRLDPPTVYEVTPTRSNTQTLYLGPSCVLTRFISWHPPFTYPYLQIPSHTLLEPRHLSRRTDYRMNRGLHPYRLSLSERMNRYRPILPSLQEEESSEVVASPQGQRRSLRIKQHRRNHSRNSGRVVAQQPTSSSSGELQIIPSDEWASHSSRYSSWRADEPEIIITSDVQLQTEDTDMVDALVYPSTSASSSSSSQSNNDDCSSSETYYRTSVYGHSSSNVTDRATQIPVQPIDNSSHDAVSTVSSASATPGGRSADSVTSRTVYRSAMPSLPTASLGSRQVANRIIRHARNNKTLNEKMLRCLNCGLLPTLPVTGQCGHTRCTRCIQTHDSCPCGGEAPEILLVNTAIQYILKKILPNDLTARYLVGPERQAETLDDTVVVQAEDAQVEEVELAYYRRLPHQSRSSAKARAQNRMFDATGRIPMSPENQYDHARCLMSKGRYREAAPHLARVAASGEPIARSARAVLSQIIELICGNRDPRRITRELFRSVRLQAASSWLRPSDLECVLCYHTYTRPVTTPCGHTYCKTCIERAMDYRKTCALCQRSLDGFDLSATSETLFVMAALESIDASSPQLPPDPDVIPIFVCTVAYPSIPCPLFIFDPRYWLMIRRVLESDSRKFGMVAYERDRNYSNYGTVLEVCDCVHLEDGRAFLSTVGVSRFRIIERDVRDGCDVARIQPLIDITPTEEIVIIDMRLMGSQILYKALMWLNNMNKTVRSEIETAFGQIPQLDQVEEDWWTSPDGPAWLWWLIAILPLRSEIKVLILSTKNLLKRMMAVARTLEAIDQASITTTATSECEIRSALTNAEEWLERGS